MIKHFTFWCVITLTVIIAAIPASASAIVWSTPTNETGNASDILTGNVVAAVFMGDIGYGTNQVSGNDIVNGVNFGYQIGATGTFNTYSNISLSGLTSTIGAVAGSGAPAGWNSAYAELTGYANGSFWGANPGLAINLTGLTIGDSYEVEVLNPWWDQPFTGTTYSDGTNTSAPVNIGVNPANGPWTYQVPQYLTGTFTATSSTLSIYPFTTGGGGEAYLISAIEVLDTTSPVITGTPEPQSFALSIMGLAGLGFFARRRRQA